MDNLNTIHLYVEIPKENTHTIKWYIETHINNRLGLICSKIETGPLRHIMKWHGVSENQVSAFQKAMGELADIYKLKFDYAVTGESDDGNALDKCANQPS